MNGNEFIGVIGLLYDDKRSKVLVAACGINIGPGHAFDKATGTASDEPGKSIELTFEDERHLESKSRDYDESRWCSSRAHVCDGNTFPAVHRRASRRA